MTLLLKKVVLLNSATPLIIVSQVFKLSLVIFCENSPEPKTLNLYEFVKLLPIFTLELNVNISLVKLPPLI